MRPRLLHHLACPIDGGSLELREWDATPSELTPETIARARRIGAAPTDFSRDITSGVLVNPRLKVFFPISGGVPRMLVFPTAATRHFAQQHAERLRADLPSFTLPTGTSMPGEETVLRTFSSEWTNYEWKGEAYWSVAPDVLFRNMRFLLNLEQWPIRDKLVLEVGIGIGGIAEYMASKEECELVGIDLGHATDAAQQVFGRRNPFFHVVQASAFALPFPDRTFDLVYSQGVLHHTHDTSLAFEHVSKKPKPGGRLYVWVYSPTSEQRTPLRRLLMSIENAVRPVVWRLPEALQTLALVPVVPLYMLHQNWLVARHHSGWAKYGWAEALHAARDRFTPRFVHRHSEDEVCGWFVRAGYSHLQRTSGRRCPDFIPESLLVGTSVQGARTA